MRVLVTGCDGYIGTVLVPLLLKSGHDVTGLDSYLFEECDFGEPGLTAASIRADIRDVISQMLEGFDALVHLAAVSNDPMGDLDPECTFAINHRGSLHLAEQAMEAGVQRFLFSSSCNYQIGEVAEIVREVMPSTQITYASGAGPDSRSYRVDFSKFHDSFPEAGMIWTVRDGVEELARAYEEHGLTMDQFQSHRLIRLEQIKRLMSEGRLDAQLRCREISPRHRSK